jgi:hypothetical protein
MLEIVVTRTKGLRQIEQDDLSCVRISSNEDKGLKWP